MPGHDRHGADDVVARWRTGRTPRAAVRAVRAPAPGGMPVVHQVATGTGALVVLFSLVTSLLALAVHLGLWHSLRHVGRILGADLAAHRLPSTTRELRTAVGRFARMAALPITTAVVACQDTHVHLRAAPTGDRPSTDGHTTDRPPQAASCRKRPGGHRATVGGSTRDHPRASDPAAPGDPGERRRHHRSAARPARS